MYINIIMTPHSLDNIYYLNGGGVSSNLITSDLKNKAYTSNEMEVYAL